MRQCPMNHNNKFSRWSEVCKFCSGWKECKFMDDRRRKKMEEWLEEYGKKERENKLEEWIEGYDKKEGENERKS